MVGAKLGTISNIQNQFKISKKILKGKKESNSNLTGLKGMKIMSIADTDVYKYCVWIYLIWTC